MALIEPKLKQRSTGELIHWTPGTYREGEEITFHRDIEDLTEGSKIGLETVEGDQIQVSVSDIAKGTFKGTVIDVKPEQPRSDTLRKAVLHDEIAFEESNILFVFSVA